MPTTHWEAARQFASTDCTLRSRSSRCRYRTLRDTHWPTGHAQSVAFIITHSPAFRNAVQELSSQQKSVAYFLRKCRNEFYVSRDCPIFWIPPIISGTGKAKKFKFCTHIHRIAQNKSPLEISAKVTVGVLRDSRKFSGHLYKGTSRGHLSTLRQFSFLIVETWQRPLYRAVSLGSKSNKIKGPPISTIPLNFTPNCHPSNTFLMGSLNRFSNVNQLQRFVVQTLAANHQMSKWVTSLFCSFLDIQRLKLLSVKE